MKKILCLLAGIFCCIFGAVSVKADVIWEPDDSFYWKHADDCTYVSRQFRANGPDNKVITYKSPEMPQVVDTWENGDQKYILFTYEDSDGVLWGIYEDSQGKTGWVPMAYMEVVYDSISFAEEYADQIIGETGSLEDAYVGQKIYLWKYPGSEAYSTIEADSYTPEYRGMYVDEAGNRWGNVWYYFGIKDTWVCIDRPTAEFEQIFPDGAPVVDKASAEMHTENTEAEQPGVKNQGTGRIVPKLNRGLAATAVILVVLVVAVTAALLVKLRGGTGKNK